MTERRVTTPRRHEDMVAWGHTTPCNTPCNTVAVLEESVRNLHVYVDEVKQCKLEYFEANDEKLEAQKEQTNKVLDELQKITQRLDNQKSFYAGVVFAVTGILGFVIYFYKEILPHVKLP